MTATAPFTVFISLRFVGAPSESARAKKEKKGGPETGSPFDLFVSEKRS
jgi:hypothetical protein